MDKFGRSYILSIDTIDPNAPPLIIQPPFTLEFSIDRNTMASTSQAKIRVLNLNAKHRNAILKDQWTPQSKRRVVLKAGYGPGPDYPTIFFGTMSFCYSFREGINFISEMECYDGGWAFASATFNGNFPIGTTFRNVVLNMAASLAPYQVTLGAISTTLPKLNQSLPKAEPYSGNTMKLIRSLVGGAAFIDNGRFNVLADSDVVPTPKIYEISSASGLLSTPRRQQTYIEWDMIFQPNIRLGQQVKLNSQTAPLFNNAPGSSSSNGPNTNTFYIIKRLYHRGTISDAVCGEVITSMSIFMGTSALTKAQNFAQAGN